MVSENRATPGVVATVANVLFDRQEILVELRDVPPKVAVPVMKPAAQSMVS
jgi:hypothetical protein